MKKCYAVIGSCFGDEGKGIMTDILCSKEPNTLNVRFNGGAQASHTVVTPDGKRHAFRHFGSGSFANADIYLSERFIVNPVAFVLEDNELKEKFNLKPKVYVHPDCIVTTLWDTYINQCIETMRDANRHGSCGFGINETVERSKNSEYNIAVKYLLEPRLLKYKLQKIQNEYVEQRLKDEYGLALKDLPEEYKKKLTDKDNIDISLFYAMEFIRRIGIPKPEIFNRYENVVFEGAQGLLLDQNNEDYFPNVTSSNTGIKNVLEVLKEQKYSGEFDIYYVSRCYMTRHGAGKFKSETNGKPYSKINDLTNIPNEFQGKLRFGILDLDLLINEIKKDLKNLDRKANINIVITCLDQLDKFGKYIENGKLKRVKKSSFLDAIEIGLRRALPRIANIYATYGPTRNDFK